METYLQTRKFSAWVIALTLVFRLFETGLPLRAAWTLAAKSSPQKIQTDAGQETRHFSFPFPAESSPPMDYSPDPTRPSFDPETEIEIQNTSSKNPDFPALLTAPLEWALADNHPTVLILHSHTSESYERGNLSYQELADYRTLDENYNMLAVGDRVAQRLEEAGIGVIHDREYHDYPSYNFAYTSARKAIQAELKNNSGILLALDLHRDAAEDNGQQLPTAITVDGQRCARLMTVLGAGRSGLPNSRWQENLSLALKLQVQLEQAAPGITRPISLRPQRFNQDLVPFSLLVEVGSAGDNLEEALRAADLLAACIVSLQNGSQ